MKTLYIHATPVVYRDFIYKIYIFSEKLIVKGVDYMANFSRGALLKSPGNSDSAFHLRKSNCLHSREFPLESVFNAFVDTNVSPVFENCMGEDDLCGNGRLPCLVMFSVALCFKPGCIVKE